MNDKCKNYAINVRTIIVFIFEIYRSCKYATEKKVWLH